MLCSIPSDEGWCEMTDDLKEAASAMGKKSAKVRMEKYGIEQYRQMGKRSSEKRRMFKKRAKTSEGK